MAKKNKFEWMPAESAPLDYPMKIISGYFDYDDASSDGIPLPSGTDFSNGWGKKCSICMVGEHLKALPNRLDITYFSYMEVAFYKGSFELPYEKILSLFADGLETDSLNPIYRFIMVGVAPGGAVAVWLAGRKTTEVFFGKAEKVDLDMAYEFRMSLRCCYQYVTDVIESYVALSSLSIIRKNGIPFSSWQQYRDKYYWELVFVMSHPDSCSVFYVNGESDYTFFPLEKDAVLVSRAVPLMLDFIVKMPGEKNKDGFFIFFDKDEVMSAFLRLAGGQEMLRLEIEPKFPASATKVRLYNDKESVDLIKFKVD